MEQIPNYKDFISETFAYTSDPFEEDEKACFVKKVKFNENSVIQLVGHVDGIKGSHTALISVRTSSLDNFGEDSLKQRIIIHQKDFSTYDEAYKHLEEMSKIIKYIG